MKKYSGFILIIILMATSFSCSNDKSSRYNAESSSSDVIVHGYISPGWIKNTNKFPVRIKQVWLHQGETTEWVRVFQPDEIRFQYISHQHGFYIFSLNGAEIGWIKPVKNGVKGKND